MFNFEYYTPTKVVFGKGVSEKVGDLVKEYGFKKVLIHYGGKSAIRSGLIDLVKSSLDAAGVSYVTLGGVVPNPRITLVYEGIELCKKENVDLILAVGGGSVIDSAKAIGYGTASGGDAWDFFSFKRKPSACLPIGVILTIAAAGSEMSNSCVITNEDGNIKRGCSSNLGRPLFALLDPELTMSLPSYQTSCGCTDILMHTMERYFTQGGNMELTDSIAEALMRTVISNSRKLIKDPDDYDARAEIMWAGSLSHNGLTECGNGGSDFATHRLEHEVSAVYDVAHGAGLAALWGSWARYVHLECLDRFYKFAVKVMDVPPSDDKAAVALLGISAVEDFFREINMPTSLKELGLTLSKEDLSLLADKCALSTRGSTGAAKKLYPADMLAIYTAANV